MNNPIGNFQAVHASSLANVTRPAHDKPQTAIHQRDYDALVLEARLRQSLATIRSLGSRGLRVAAVEARDGTPAFSSRWCRGAFVCPKDAGAEAYLQFLERTINQADVGVLITSSDANVQLIRQHRERLERRAHIALAREPALGIALSKERTLEIAGQLGLNIPRSVVVREISEIASSLHEVGLPAIVKPVESWKWSMDKGVGLACKLVTTPDEARRAVEEVTNLGVNTIFQQYLTGRREAVSLLYAHGRIYARFAQWAKRTVPPLGGTSVLRQSIAIPQDIGEQAERLVREIELEGYSEVEFRRDSAGEPYLMEINPRLSASVEIAVRAGVDFPYLLYQWASGDQITVVPTYRVGGWMRYLGGDLQSTVEAIQRRDRPEMPAPARALFDFSASFFLPTRYDYLDWRDPLPAGIAALDSARYWSRRIAKRLLRGRPQ